MKFPDIIKHIGIVIASTVILVGIPLWSTGFLNSLFSDNPDAVSGASVILEKPSGKYLIFINKDLHQDTDILKEWITFFSGGDILYIFEDIACSVASGDLGGKELAESFRSQLPENQMRVKEEDATLIVSRMDERLYDIVILSGEFAEMFSASSSVTDSDIVIELIDIPSDERHFHTSYSKVS